MNGRTAKRTRKEVRKLGRKFAGEFREAGILFRYRVTLPFVFVFRGSKAAIDWRERGRYFLRR